MPGSTGVTDAPHWVEASPIADTWPSEHPPDPLGLKNNVFCPGGGPAAANGTAAAAMPRIPMTTAMMVRRDRVARFIEETVLNRQQTGAGRDAAPQENIPAWPSTPS
jgi:hypothetical protein